MLPPIKGNIAPQTLHKTSSVETSKNFDQYAM